MLTIPVDYGVEQQIEWASMATHKTIAEIVSESLALYIAQHAVPNDETIQVIRDASEGKNMEIISFEQFCSDLMAV